MTFCRLTAVSVIRHKLSSTITQISIFVVFLWLLSGPALARQGSDTKELDYQTASQPPSSGHRDVLSANVQRSLFDHPAMQAGIQLKRNGWGQLFMC